MDKLKIKENYSKDFVSGYLKGYEECETKFKNTLKHFAEIVDDALLLDEELALAWEDLHKGVNKVREFLKEKE